MGQTVNHGNRRKKEGLTLAETVIALAIIVLVSLGATSLVIYSSNALQSARERRFFGHEVEAISMLYLSYTDKEDFAQAVNDYRPGVDILDTGALVDTTIYYSSKFIPVGSTDPYAFYLTLDFEGDDLNITANRAKGDLLITQRSLTR